MMADKERVKKNSCIDSNSTKTTILLRLAQGSAERNDLLAELKEKRHDPKALTQILNELVKSGLVRMDGKVKKRYTLRQDFPTFKMVFGLCAADGRDTEFLATAYSRAIFSKDIFLVLTREFVHSAILSTILLLTLSPFDRAKNSSLLLLHKAVYNDSSTSEAIQGIAGSLQSMGFPEALRKRMAKHKTKQEGDAETLTMLEELADEFLSYFLGTRTPLPSALEGCQSLLFPEKERGEMLDILRGSPFALSFLLANEDRSQGTVMSIVTPLLLPSLEHMFTLFALFKLFSSLEIEAYEKDKKKADREFMEVVERQNAGMQPPSQLLQALRSCSMADRAERQSITNWLNKKLNL